MIECVLAVHFKLVVTVRQADSIGRETDRKKEKGRHKEK